MKALLNFWRAWRLFGLAGRAALNVEKIEVQWTLDDRAALRQFLKTSTGRKLKALALKHTGEATLRAVDTWEGDKFQTGTAYGARLAHAALIALSEPPTPQPSEEPEFVVAESGGGFADRDS